MAHKDKHIDHLLPDYIDGNLEKAELASVEAHLASCPSCKQEMEDLRVLIDALKSDATPAPSEDLQKRFYQQLEWEKGFPEAREKRGMESAPIRSFQYILRIAAGLALLVTSFYAGRYQQTRHLQNEIAALQDTSREMKQLAVLSLMENQSASRRIQGVGFIEEFAEPDPTILQALIQRLQDDENTNVRLAAAESLSRFRASEQVKQAFIETLDTEKDPGIQITIIRSLADIADQKAVQPFRELLNREDTQPFVKAEIEALLPKIL